MVCVCVLSREYSGSCSGVMLLLVAYSALCVSGSLLFLARFPPCPILQSVDQITVLCALHLSQLHDHHTLHHPPTPQTPKPLHARKNSSRSAVRANMLQPYREKVVIVVGEEPVELKCRNTRL